MSMSGHRVLSMPSCLDPSLACALRMPMASLQTHSTFCSLRELYCAMLGCQDTISPPHKNLV